jgi:hypothetical protein
LRKKTSPLALGLFLGGFAVFAVALVLFIYFYTRPKGELVGVLPVGADDTWLQVDANAGDALHFRLDYALDRTRFSGDKKAQDRAMYAGLWLSTVSVTVRAPGGSQRTTTCPAYAGRAFSRSGTTTETVLEGVITECTVPLSIAGKYTVRGGITWDAAIGARWAKLEVRREPPATK